MHTSVLVTYSNVAQYFTNIFIMYTRVRGMYQYTCLLLHTVSMFGTDACIPAEASCLGEPTWRGEGDQLDRLIDELLGSEVPLEIPKLKQ